MTMQIAAPPIRRLPRQSRSLALVDAIIEAAARILVRDGRDALTTNSVAEVAGVSIGSLYQYFPNRDAVILAVAERHDRRLRDAMQPFDPGGQATIAAAVGQLVAAAFAAHRVEPALHRALAHDLANGRGTDRAPLGTRPVLLAATATALARMDGRIARPCARIAAETVGEIVHALAHAGATSGDRAREREAIVAALAYLGASNHEAADVTSG